MASGTEKWMKKHNVHQLDLRKMLERKGIDTLDQFKAIPVEEVKALILEAKKTGFMHSAKLKELHGGFPKKKKNPNPKSSNKSKRKSTTNRIADPADLKRKARPILEEWMRSHKIWQIDLFDLMTDQYHIYSPQQFEEYKKDSEWVDQFLTDAKQQGVIGTQATALAVFCGKKKKRKNKKKVEVEQKEHVPMRKDHKDLKVESRPKLEKFLRHHDVWQIDIFNLLTDEFHIYSVDEFNECKQDKEWIDEFLQKSKQRGVMGSRFKKLEVLLGRKSEIQKKKKKKESPKKSAVKKQKVLDPKEIENMARDQMEGFMKEQGFWNLDLFLILCNDWNVHQPDDLTNLSKSDRKKVIQKAKLNGVMPATRKKFKAYFD